MADAEVRGYSEGFRVWVPYRTGSRLSCSTSGNTASPLEPGRSWLLLCPGRSLLLVMLQDKHTHNKAPVRKSSSHGGIICSWSFYTWCFCRAALDFTALLGFWLEGRVAAVTPRYQLLPLVTLDLSDLDATPTGLAALSEQEVKLANCSLLRKV